MLGHYSKKKTDTTEIPITIAVIVILYIGKTTLPELLLSAKKYTQS